MRLNTKEADMHLLHIGTLFLKNNKLFFYKHFQNKTIMNKETLLSIGKGTMTVLSLAVSVITIVDFGIGMARKYRKPNKVDGFAAPTTED
jgi:hypothetical protein